MSKIDPLLDFYKELLSSLNIFWDENGLLFAKSSKKNLPLVVDDKRLALPMNDLLRRTDSSEFVFFNPLSEDIRYGESLVIQRLKSIINVMLNLRFTQLGVSVLQVLENPANHANFNKAQNDFLYKVSELDTTTTTNFSKVSTAGVKKNFADAFISIFLNRGIELTGTKYSRAGIVTVKFLSELEKCGDSPFGSRVRKKDVEAFKSLTLAIFNKYESDKDSYSYGSGSKTAPYFASLVGALLNVNNVYNSVYKLFKEFIPDYMDHIVDMSSIENKMDDLQSFNVALKLLPTLESNTGSPSVNDIDLSAMNTPVTKMPAQTNPNVQQNAYVPPLAPVSNYQQGYTQPPPQRELSVLEKLRALGGNNGLYQNIQPITPPVANRYIDEMYVQPNQYANNGIPFNGPYTQRSGVNFY